MADTKPKSNSKKIESPEISDIIRSNHAIRSRIVKEISKQDFRYTDLIDKAAKDDIILNKASLSRYINNTDQVKGVPTQEAILWLCKFLKIKVDVSVE